MAKSAVAVNKASFTHISLGKGNLCGVVGVASEAIYLVRLYETTRERERRTHV